MVEKQLSKGTSLITFLVLKISAVTIGLMIRKPRIWLHSLIRPKVFSTSNTQDNVTEERGVFSHKRQSLHSKR